MGHEKKVLITSEIARKTSKKSLNNVRKAEATSKKGLKNVKKNSQHNIKIRF